MKLPFVSRERFNEVKQELADLRRDHRRVVDEINYRNTGFHLYPEFDVKPVVTVESPAPKADALNDPKKEEENPETNIRAFLKRAESQNLSQFEEHRRKQLELQQAAADKLGEALSDADQAATKGA